MVCKECVHQAVCKVYGGLFPKRNDVERICEHFMNTSVLGFNPFWKQQFEEKEGK